MGNLHYALGQAAAAAKVAHDAMKELDTRIQTQGPGDK
jgi:hypothetical protein